MSDIEYAIIGQKAIHSQSLALEELSNNLPKDFASLIGYITKELKGRVVTIGIGKSGYIAQKIAASLASTGTPAFFVHPAEASHGDLGMITKQDIVVMISNSGETKELFDAVDYCKKFEIKIVAITMKERSTLALNSDFLLCLPQVPETTENISAPTTSALMALSIGDAIVTTLAKVQNFQSDQFKIFHPGGQIGVNLLRVRDIMHQGEEIPFISQDKSFAEAIIAITTKRLGCAIVVDDSRTLLGIITDGDVRRHIGQDFSELYVRDVMSHSPNVISQDLLASQALVKMNERQITILPVLENGQVIGILHIHDIIKRGIGE